MRRYLVTGGSGFIGTNVVDFLIKQNDCVVLNIDTNKPKCNEHLPYWKRIDICDKVALTNAIKEFDPTHVLHLAARTDLQGEHVDAYAPNTTGVENLLYSLEGLCNLERVLFTSSMLVCRVGYAPKHEKDYSPSTYYGESKVITEQLIHRYNPIYTWCIIRPTSIWGPWFGVPYANFFKMILAHTYVDMGKHACTKTYGYIENAIYQMMTLLSANKEDIHQKMFYIGDYEPYNISVWAKEIGKEAGVYIPTVPFVLLKVASKFGDLLTKIGLPFPMTSFRLKNMTTDNIVDTTNMQKVAPNLPVSRKEGVVRTLQWLKNSK